MTDTNQQTASLPRRGIRRRWIVLTVLLLIGAVFAGPYYWKVYRRHQARQFIVASGGFIMKGDAPFMMLCPSTPPPVTAPVSERIRFEWLEFWERRDVERRRQDCYSISVTAPGSRQPASRLLPEFEQFRLGRRRCPFASTIVVALQSESDGLYLFWSIVRRLRRIEFTA